MSSFFGLPTDHVPWLHPTLNCPRTAEQSHVTKWFWGDNLATVDHALALVAAYREYHRRTHDRPTEALVSDGLRS